MTRMLRVRVNYMPTRRYPHRHHEINGLFCGISALWWTLRFCSTVAGPPPGRRRPPLADLRRPVCRAGRGRQSVYGCQVRATDHLATTAQWRHYRVQIETVGCRSPGRRTPAVRRHLRQIILSSSDEVCRVRLAASGATIQAARMCGAGPYNRPITVSHRLSIGSHNLLKSALLGGITRRSQRLVISLPSAA